MAVDFTESAYFARAAAEQGHKEAQCNLGLAYCKGQGMPQSYVDAKTWLGKAAAQGDMLARNELRKVDTALAVIARGHDVYATFRARDGIFATFIFHGIVSVLSESNPRAFIRLLPSYIFSHVHFAWGELIFSPMLQNVS